MDQREVHVAGRLALEARFDCFAHAPGGRAVEPQRLRRPLHEVEVAHHVVIENRDVPARHVGDDGRVLVLPQLAHDPAHRDDVVVGMRRKDQHPPARRQLGPPADLARQAVEHHPVDRSGGGVLREQRAQMVLGVVARGELENGLPRLLGEPHDRAIGHRGRPLDALQQPRCIDPRQLRRRREVEIHGGVAMALQERRRDVPGDLALDGAPHDRGLVLARRDQGDLPGPEDGGHAHRDRFARHVVLAEEVGRRVLPGHGVERHEAGARVGRGTGLVEADVAALADAEDLEVDAAGFADRPLVRGAVLLEPLARRPPVRDVHVLGADVHVGEQVLPHVAPIAVWAVGRHGIVLVEVECHHVREIDLARVMAADQLAVDAEGRAARGEPEDRAALGGRLLGDHLDDAVGHEQRHVVVVAQHHRADALAVTRSVERAPRRARRLPGLLRAGCGHLALFSSIGRHIIQKEYAG